MEPPPPPRAPPALADELVEEIVLRFPPDDPAGLVRAALVCKRWCRLVSAHAFRRRFRGLHRRPAPMLGFLCNDVSRVAAGGDEACSARFVRTAASCPPVASRRGWHALDARAGRVLLHRAAAQVISLAVWDPLAAGDSHHLDLPAPALPRRPRSWNAALLCDDDGLDADGPFRVVLVGTDPEPGIFAYVYSSSDGPSAAWSEPAYAPQQQQQQPDAGGGGHNLDAVRGALVGDALYFVFQRRTRALRYDLGTRAISVVHLPPASHNQRIVLTTTEDGGLGFARMEGYRLCLWSSMEARPDGDAGGALEWTKGRVIDLRTLLPVIDLLGFVHGVGIILVGTVDGFFSVDQKSGRINKVGDGPGFYNVVPYVSFCTPGPALVTASADEGPTSANA
ncbi:hypothetical protein BAE44_0010240 [Dichanthelium oligosanthes]|uniref:F-box domain-containing protein n=1 Tax=Dichanthelium oligosanthes TaxID=888268 RepID=A0A1E5VUE2_9POAL|nr:hypothetical protein BAE44_0010240 [Dichanthelium oligosanthes]